MLGDAPDFGAPEPHQPSDAGTTPGEPVSGTDPEASATAGDGAATPAGDGTTPDAAATPPAEDPFAETEPATFMVNGQPVTNEDIRVFKEGGAVIPPERLQSVLQKLSERESLQERHHAQSVENRTLLKATEWTDAASGKTYQGPEAAVEMRIGNASLFAENQLLVQTITDPDQLERCLTTVQVPDGKGGFRERVVFSEQALESLRTRNELAQVKAAQAIRSHYQQVIAEASKPSPAPIDYPKASEGLLSQIAAQAQLDASLLSPEDKATLAEQLPFHVKDGNASVAWQNLAKRMMQVAATNKANAQTLVSTTQKATLDGAARLAAAARGVKPNKPAAPVAPKAQPKPQDDTQENQASAFDLMLSSGAKAMRSLNNQ